MTSAQPPSQVVLSIFRARRGSPLRRGVSLLRSGGAVLLATSLGMFGCAAPRPQAAPSEHPEATSSTSDTPPSDQDEQPTRVYSSRRFNSLAEAQAAFDQDAAQLDELFGSGVAVTLDSGGNCTRACRAFASLNRSAAGICELAGDEDERCGRARSKIDENQRRINEAGCNCD